MPDAKHGGSLKKPPKPGDHKASHITALHDAFASAKTRGNT